MNERRSQLIADLATPRDNKLAGRQAETIGFKAVTPKALDVTMTPALDRKKVAGSPLTPGYWLERIYQACKEGLYAHPRDAYKAILRQAKATGLSSDQQETLDRHLAAVGFDVGDAPELEQNYRMASATGYCGNTTRTAAAPPETDVVGDIVAAVRRLNGATKAVERLGKYIADQKRQASQRQISGHKARRRQYEAQARPIVAALGGDAEADRLAYLALDGRPEWPATPTLAVRVARAVVASYSPDNEKLVQAGWSREEVARREFRKAQMATTDPAIKQIDQNTPVPAGTKKTVLKDSTGKDALVVQKNDAPPIRTALHAHLGTMLAEGRVTTPIAGAVRRLIASGAVTTTTRVDVEVARRKAD